MTSLSPEQAAKHLADIARSLSIEDGTVVVLLGVPKEEAEAYCTVVGVVPSVGFELAATLGASYSKLIRKKLRDYTEKLSGK